MLSVGAYWSPTMALAALGVALILAAAIMLFKRSKLKSVRSERTACNYTRPGSFKLTAKRDNFLFANTIRTPRPQNNTGGGGRRRS
jgi:hypothetical protein